jgi:hypothetical protein
MNNTLNFDHHGYLSIYLFGAFEKTNSKNPNFVLGSPEGYENSLPNPV